MRRLPLLAWTLLALAAAPATAPGAPGSGMDEAVTALDAPRWEDRRRAERALLEEGLAALRDEDEATGPGRRAAWDAALVRAERQGGPAARDAVPRILKSVEARASDPEVRRSRRLVRARLDRLLPEVVLPPGTSYGREGEEFALREAFRSVSSLMPEAAPVLLDVVRGHSDARRTAAAAAVLLGEDLEEPLDAALVAAVVAAWDADPARVREAARHGRGWNTGPGTGIGLCLALGGRASALRTLRPDDLRPEPIGSLLRAQVRARGDADLDIGDFLTRVETGEAEATVEAEAAGRAASAGLPWLARLLARRALFLAPGDEAAVRRLVEADRALGLRATARADAGLPRADGEEDDPEARDVMVAFAEGRLAQRVLHRLDAGSTILVARVPVALARGLVLHGSTNGSVLAVDAATGDLAAARPTGASRTPRDLAVSGELVAAVASDGTAAFWSLGEDRTLEPVARVRGPWFAVAAARDGGFWLAAAHAALWRAKDPRTPKRVEGLPDRRGTIPEAIAELGDGSVAMLARGEVFRADLSAKTWAALHRGAPGEVRLAAYGPDLLVAEGSSFSWLGPDGARKGGGSRPRGARILGVGGDPASGTVYLAQQEALHAVAAADGTERWTEAVEGSGNPAVGFGLVAVASGTGSLEGGDNRRDRTVSVLLAERTGPDPFAPPSRAKAVDAAVAAAEEGDYGVAFALLDPLGPWMTDAERREAARRIGEASDASEPGPARSPPRDG